MPQCNLTWQLNCLTPSYLPAFCKVRGHQFVHYGNLSWPVSMHSTRVAQLWPWSCKILERFQLEDFRIDRTLSSQMHLSVVKLECSNCLLWYRISALQPPFVLLHNLKGRTISLRVRTDIRQRVKFTPTYEKSLLWRTSCGKIADGRLISELISKKQTSPISWLYNIWCFRVRQCTYILYHIL